MEKCLKVATPLSRKNARKSLAVTEKCQTVGGLLSRKNAKISHVRSYKKNAKESQVRGHGKMSKTPRSAVTEKYKKCIGLQVCKMPKTRRSFVLK